MAEILYARSRRSDRSLEGRVYATLGMPERKSDSVEYALASEKVSDRIRMQREMRRDQEPCAGELDHDLRFGAQNLGAWDDAADPTLRVDRVREIQP